MSTVDDVRSLEQLADDVPTKFPSAPYANTSSYFDAYAQETARAARSIEPAALDRAAAVLLKAYAGGAGVFSCGNGGSAAVANHLQCDHLKTVRTRTDLAPRVVSLSTNIELISAIANDIGYDDVFAYQLQSQSRPGDVLIAVSSSGRSANIVNALTWARDHDVGTIALTGFDGGIAKVIADVCVHVEGTNYGIVEDLHQAIMHALAQSIRQSRMSEEAILSSVF
jgi:D-sedoheptulose 7-phosphate isomerase/D-glycero-D-manno-heptose 1,7-bisphosphate phosphatase